MSDMYENDSGESEKGGGENNPSGAGDPTEVPMLPKRINENLETVIAILREINVKV